MGGQRCELAITHTNLFKAINYLEGKRAMNAG